MSKENLISRIPNSEEDFSNSLDPTEERMIFDNLWAHFWPTSSNLNHSGLSGVMSYLLRVIFLLHTNLEKQH